MMFKKQVINCVRLLIRKSPFVVALRKIFRKKPHEKAIRIGEHSGWPSAADWMLHGEGKSILLDRKFHRKFRNDINTDIKDEFLLTALRSRLLLSETDGFTSVNISQLILTLIIQAHHNEFVWFSTKEEKDKINTLISKAEFNAELSNSDLVLSVLLLMYAKVGQIQGLSFERHRDILKSIKNLPEELKQLVGRYIDEIEEIQRLKLNIKKYGAIERQTSKEIAKNYEDYPYPRWLSWDISDAGSRIKLLSNFYSKNELNFVEDEFNVLVAGCGTGSKAIQYAIEYGDKAKITAVDLSTASLAYATKMAKKYDVNNIEFIQMDLLDLPQLDKSFDIVECTGVLHHMKDPVEGGLAIIDRVRESGLIHISLYSELARKSIVEFRERYNLSADMTNDDIRKMRHLMMENDSDIIDKALSLRWDFFDLNRCKDLLFHPLEHRYTIPQLESFLSALNIEFRGLEKPDIVRSQCWTHYPSEKDRMSFRKWNEFELKHPDAFGGLFEIWGLKPK